VQGATQSGAASRTYRRASQRRDDDALADASLGLGSKHTHHPHRGPFKRVLRRAGPATFNDHADRLFGRAVKGRACGAVEEMVHRTIRHGQNTEQRTGLQYSINCAKRPCRCIAIVYRGSRRKRRSSFSSPAAGRAGCGVEPHRMTRGATMRPTAAQERFPPTRKRERGKQDRSGDHS